MDHGCTHLGRVGRNRFSFGASCLQSRRLVLGALVLLACVVGTSKAQTPFQMSIAPAFGDVYPVGRWLPLQIDLRNDTDRNVDGEIRMPISLPGVVTEFKFPASVPSRSRLSFVAYAYLPESLVSQPSAGRKSDTGAVAIAEWVQSDGARLARAELLGRPDIQKTDGGAESASSSGFLLLSAYGDRAIDSRESFQVSRLCESLSTQSGFPLTPGQLHVSALPRHVAGYGAVRAVILNGVSPDALDESQRRALKAYLVGGGVVVLPAPIGDSDPTTSWMGRMLPVQTVGRRDANVITEVGLEDGANSARAKSSELRLRESIELCEAVDAGGIVLLRDPSFVHAAYTVIGLGRVVFLSVPVNSFDPTDARTQSLWRRLLELDRPTHDWEGSGLQAERDRVLESMIGAPTPPWSHAAMIAGGYLSIMLVVQLLFTGARRPAAFAIGAGVAIASCGTLLIISTIRQSDGNSLSAAGLATVDLGAGGGGFRREVVAFFGRDEPEFSLKCPDSVTLRPIAASAGSPAPLMQLPFAAPNAGVRSGRVDRVWEASQPLDQSVTLQAGATFEADKISLRFDNRLGAVLRSPVVIWNRGCYRLSDLPLGESDALLGAKNPTGDFTNVSVIAGEEDILKARIVKASISASASGRPAPIDDGQPLLVGWLEPAATELSTSLTTYSHVPDRIRAQVMVRVPIQIKPSPISDSIHIPSDFIKVVGGAGQGVFYDEVAGEWVQSMQAGSWLIGFRAPPEIGRIRPTRATLRADLLAPGHKISFRRGQTVEGQATENAGGEVVADWNRAVGTRSARFELEASDVDSSGRVWLLLEVEEAGSAGDAGVLAQWKFNRLELELDASVESRK